MPIAASLREISASPLVELFMLSQYNPAAPTEVFRFTGWQECEWLGVEWLHLGCKTSGFESNSRALPRPRLQVSNIGGEVAAIVRQFDDLIGATIHRYRTQEIYLQAGSPDMLLVDEFEIQQKTNEDRLVIEWELSAINLENKECPARTYQRNYCDSQYRSADCGYTGPPVATINDVATTDPALDDCGRKLGSCRLRFGPTAPLPISYFPGLP